MATTTNYGWDTPDDTDLVKDGAAAIRTLGSSIDTTTKNLNPQTTTGALAYRSATANVNTALPIGTAGQILAVSGGVPAWINNDQGDITEVQAGVGISVASGSGPIPVITNSSTDLITTAGDLLYGTAADTVARLGIGTAGQILKVNSGATAPEWGAAAASTPTYRGVGVYLTSSISIPNNAWTVVGWTNEHFDSDAYHDNSTNNSRLTIPAGYAGKYLISGNTNWDAYANASIRGIQIYKNGVGGIIPVVVLPITNGTNGTNTSFAYVINLAVSDYIEIYVYQNTGGNANLVGGTGNSAIQLSLLGA